MNTMMVERLVWKDWHFNRGLITFYIAIGAVALVLVGIATKVAFFSGSILFVTVLIGLGIHLAMATVVNERKLKNLPFVMSLPISILEYTTAKVVANLLIFLVPWIALMVGSVAVISSRAALPNGMIPFAVVVIGELLAAYCLILGVALVSESEGWTIAAVVVCNLFFNFFLYWVSHLPAMEASMQDPTVVWGSTVIRLLLAELAVVVLVLGLTFFFQARKKDFL